MSRRLTNKLRHPVQLAADIVERVLATDGEMYLDIREHKLTWWQLSLLDVKLALLVVAALLLGLLAAAAFLIVRLIARGVSFLLQHSSWQKQKLV